MIRWGLIFSIVLLLCPPAWTATDPLPPVEDYVGSEGCKKCHEDKYDGWKRTFHSTVVQDAKLHPESILGDFNQEGIGFTKHNEPFYWTNLPEPASREE